MDVILLSNSHKFPNCNDLSERGVLSSFLFIMIIEKGVTLEYKISYLIMMTILIY